MSIALLFIFFKSGALHIEISHRNNTTNRPVDVIQRHQPLCGRGSKPSMLPFSSRLENSTQNYPKPVEHQYPTSPHVILQSAVLPHSLGQDSSPCHPAPRMPGGFDGGPSESRIK